MRFMVMVGATKESEAGELPKPEAFAAMQEYNEALVKAGVLLAAEGLAPTSKGARVRFDGDERTVLDGPFAESKEVVAGFSILRVDSLQEAIDWVKRTPNIFPNGQATVEIRKLMDVEDFGEGFEGAAARSSALRRLSAASRSLTVGFESDCPFISRMTSSAVSVSYFSSASATATTLSQFSSRIRLASAYASSTIRRISSSMSRAVSSE